MGCATKNAKVVAISLGSLQRLIVLKAVPLSAVPMIVNTMTDAMSQGVDIQLKALQTLVSLITGFPEVHGELLGDVRPLYYIIWRTELLITSRPCCFASNCKNPKSRSYPPLPQRPYVSS